MSTCISQKYIQHSKRQATKQVWKLTRKLTTVIWIAKKKGYLSSSFLLSEYIEWRLMRRILVKILVFDVWDALKPMNASKLSNTTDYLTVFHYHEATPVNVHR